MAEFSDIIQAKFVDSYANLTVKSIALIRWVVDYCSQAEFMLKADDDMYINVPLLIDVLKVRTSSKPFVIGSVQVIVNNVLLISSPVPYKFLC